MSSAANHSKRSRRGHYKAQAFQGGRRSVITPTARKQDYYSWMLSIRKAFERPQKRGGAGESSSG